VPPATKACVTDTATTVLGVKTDMYSSNTAVIANMHKEFHLDMDNSKHGDCAECHNE